MSYRLKQTLQYGVTPPQAFATTKAQLPTAFPLESAVAAKVSRERIIPKSGIRFADKMLRRKGVNVENRKALEYTAKSAARRGGTFVFGRRMTPKKWVPVFGKVMRKRNCS
jgi:hypothetical protein